MKTLKLIISTTTLEQALTMLVSVYLLIWVVVLWDYFCFLYDLAGFNLWMLASFVLDTGIIYDWWNGPW
jgi:hypothetical protein